MKYICNILFFVLLSGGCGTSSNSTTNEPNGIKKSVIAPAATNKSINKGTDKYYVFTPSSKNAEDKLLIFLPGSLAAPKIYQDILRTGAEDGYYSVGLSYQNNFTLTGQCRGEGPDCEGNLSREELEGKDFSDKVEVSRASSFEGRIIALVHYMQQQNLDAGWGQFVQGGEIQWRKIIIAGHSQGSSHAAYIGWHRPVARAGFFSGPHNVANRQGEAAVSWLKDKRLTPASRFYGFGNTKDKVTDFRLQKAAWSVMDLPGAVVSVDEAESPFNQSHRLSTSVGSDNLFNGAHGSTCVDSQTPQDGGGNSVFRPVWGYMLFQ